MGLIIQVEGDPNTGDGLIETPLQTFFKVSGKLVSVDGSPVSDHPPDHTGVKTTNGSSFFSISGKAINIFSRKDTCDHTRNGQTASWFTIEN